MGWTLFFMMVVLKIPMIAAGYLIWYAVKEEPEARGGAGHRQGPAPQDAALPALAAPRPGRRRRWRLQAGALRNAGAQHPARSAGRPLARRSNRRLGSGRESSQPPSGAIPCWLHGELRDNG